MIPLIVITLLVGIVLGQFLGGALRAILIVAVAVFALGFIGTHFNVDVRGFIDEGVAAGKSAIEEFQQKPVVQPRPIPPGLREARRRI